jgi:ribulose-bisphosphate carboxylase large chain
VERISIPTLFLPLHFQTKDFPMSKTESIKATYTIRSNDVSRAASLIAREMSLGVKKTSYETKGTDNFAAKAVIKKQGKKEAIIEIMVPSQRISSAYGLVLSIAGEISCLNILKSIELSDFDLPVTLLSRLPGPTFGAEGISKKRKDPKRPLFITVLKPSQGLTPKEFSQIAYESLVGGMDVVKSDELLQEPETDYLRRLEATVAMAKKAEEETGEPKWVMMHPVDHPKAMIDRYVKGAKTGSEIAMLSPAASGFPMLEELSRLSKVPIMAHMATSDWLWQPHGMSVRAWAKFMRILGSDIILYPALSGTLKAKKSHLKTVHEICHMPLKGIPQSMIAVGGGMHAGTLAIHADLFGHNFAYLCGGGVCGHPDGARAGGQSIRQAWDAYSLGIPLEKYRKKHKSLDRALSAFATYV